MLRHRRRVRAVLNSMDIYRLEEGGAAHVLWVRPKTGIRKIFLMKRPVRSIEGVAGWSATTDAREMAIRQISDNTHSSIKGVGVLVEGARALKVRFSMLFILSNPVS